MLSALMLLLYGFGWGLRRGASVCVALCVPSIMPRLVDGNKGWRSGLWTAFLYNLPRIVALTALGAAIGACFALAGNVYAWAVVGFLVMFVGPFCGGSSQAIWQSKVAPEVQGRVFATRRMIAQVSAPIAMLMVGPLADDIFEPGMASGGSMSSTFGWLVGTGPGAGMGLIIFLTSMLTVAVAFSAYAVKAIRNVERDLPDHDAAAQAAHPACASSVEGTTDASAPAKAPAPEAEPTGA
jgi:hypothetical protein